MNKFLTKILYSLFFSILIFNFSLQALMADTAFEISLKATAQKTGHITGEDNGLQISGIIGLSIKILLNFIGIIFIILIIYSGYTWMISRGNDVEVQKAKDTITRAIIGLFIVMAAYAITTFIGKSF